MTSLLSLLSSLKDPAIKESDGDVVFSAPTSPGFDETKLRRFSPKSFSFFAPNPFTFDKSSMVVGSGSREQIPSIIFSLRIIEGDLPRILDCSIRKSSSLLRSIMFSSFCCRLSIISSFSIARVLVEVSFSFFVTLVLSFIATVVLLIDRYCCCSRLSLNPNWLMYLDFSFVPVCITESVVFVENDEFDDRNVMFVFSDGKAASNLLLLLLMVVIFANSMKESEFIVDLAFVSSFSSTVFDAFGVTEEATRSRIPIPKSSSFLGPIPLTLERSSIVKGNGSRAQIPSTTLSGSMTEGDLLRALDCTIRNSSRLDRSFSFLIGRLLLFSFVIRSIDNACDGHGKNAQVRRPLLPTTKESDRLVAVPAVEDISRVARTKCQSLCRHKSSSASKSDACVTTVGIALFETERIPFLVCFRLIQPGSVVAK
mmetsp:Transcript_12869/g.32420  ORF Transcript_12869/g.32420 Transcript_12869/m.32420 type:complete len:426 (+) Transcript_12869:51-1328(+)